MMQDTAVATARGASYFVIQSIITTLGMAISFAILARIVTTADMGILAVLTLIVAISQTVVGPISQAVTKFVAENLSTESNTVSSSAFFQCLRLTLILAGAFALIVFLGAPVLSLYLLGRLSYAEFFQILAVDVVFTGLTPVLSGGLLGLRKYKEIAVVGIASTLLRQALIILLIIILKNFIGLVIGWLISDLLASILYSTYLLKIFRRPSFSFPLRELLNYSWPLSISSSLNFAQSWFDRTLLIFYVPLAALGVYNATVTAFGVLLGISAAMVNSLFPLYSSHGPEQYVNLKESVRLATRYSSFIILPLAWGLIATAKLGLTFFLGKAYLAGTEPLIIMTLSFAIGAFAITAVQPVLLALGETLPYSAISVISVLTSIGLALILLPISGIVGAAIARAVGMILMAALVLVAVHNKLGLRIDKEGIWKSNVAAIVMAGTLMVLQFFMYRELLLPVYAAIGLAVYLAMLRLLKAVHEEDVELIRRYLGRRLSFVAKSLRILVAPARSETIIT
jgi:O-antigen/teichoic acid export membrane protein